MRSFRRLAAESYEDYCWGYPFDWETRTGTIKAGTPLITTVPYVYEAFSQVYAIDGDQKWLPIMRSIAEHAFRSYRDLETAPDTASCAYTPAPDDPCGVINASAYRAFLLTKAGIELSQPQYLEVAKQKSELRPGLSKHRWFLVLFDGWEEGFCRSLSYLLCSQSPRKDRRTNRILPVQERYRAWHRLLREELVRHRRPAVAILQGAAAHGVPPGAL